MEFSKLDSAILYTIYLSVDFWSIAKYVCMPTKKF